MMARDNSQLEVLSDQYLLRKNQTLLGCNRRL